MNRMTKKALIQSSADCAAGKMRMDNGFSLVEILVGMVIGLLGIIIITQIFALAEGQKRTTTSGADAQTNGNIALYSIERDVRQAGYGLNLSALGCSTRTSLAGNTALPLERAPYADGTIVLAPVIIIDGGTNAVGDALPDTLRTLYSTNLISSLPQKLQTNHAQAATQGSIGSTFNMANGDMVVFQETGENCALAQVTGAPPTATTFNHDNSLNPNWNNSAIFPGAGYASGASVFDLGSMAWRRYFIDPADDNLLRFQEVNANGNTGSTNAVVAASEIVNLQAQYGQDNGVNNGTVPTGPYAANDGKVDSWNTATPGLVPPAGAGTNAQWQQIIAVRIAILARSGQYEKPDPVLGCTATTVAPSWSGGTMAVPPFPNAGLPSCYRYKMFETVVPLRNIIWGI
jgi:type IV pilus assembly protein PilW